MTHLFHLEWTLFLYKPYEKRKVRRERTVVARKTGPWIEIEGKGDSLSQARCWHSGCEAMKTQTTSRAAPFRGKRMPPTFTSENHLFFFASRLHATSSAKSRAPINKAGDRDGIDFAYLRSARAGAASVPIVVTHLHAWLTARDARPKPTELADLGAVDAGQAHMHNLNSPNKPPLPRHTRPTLTKSLTCEIPVTAKVASCHFLVKERFRCSNVLRPFGSENRSALRA